MSLATLHASSSARPLAFRQYLPGQAEFRAARERCVIWFGFNGCGKTAGLVSRLVDVFEGIDPICEGNHRPLSILLCVTAYDHVSCRDFAEQLKAMCPEGLVAQQDIDKEGKVIGRAMPWYARGKGFRGRPPRLVVQYGPMAGTTLNITTLGSGASAAAGGSIDLVLINEPVSRGTWEELTTRDRAKALGYSWYVFTPIPGAPDQLWVKEVSSNPESGVRFIQTRLTPEALVFPSGRRLESWKKTSERIAKWSPETVLMRSGESLEELLEGTYFTGIWTSDLVTDQLDRFAANWCVAALDYSTKWARTRFVVVGWIATGEPRHVEGVVLADYRAESSDPGEVARGVLRCLDEAGIPISSIDQWVGDRAAIADRGLIYRDNVEFLAAMIEELKKKHIPTPRALFDIRTPYKRPGSSMHMMTQIRTLFARKWLLVHPRCKEIQKDVFKWDGTKNHPAKDGLDAVGYGYHKAAMKYNLWSQPVDIRSENE